MALTILTLSDPRVGVLVLTDSRAAAKKRTVMTWGGYDLGGFVQMF